MDLFNSAFVGLTILAMAGSVTFAMYSVGGTALAVVVGAILFAILAGIIGTKLPAKDGPWSNFSGLAILVGVGLIVLAVPFGAFLSFLPTHGMAVAIFAGIVTLIGIILLGLLVRFGGPGIFGR